MKKVIFSLLVLLFGTTLLIGQEKEWILSEKGITSFQKDSLFVRNDMPKKYKLYDLKLNSFNSHVCEAMAETASIIELPTSEGIKRFRIKETSILSEDYAKKFPNIKTYTGCQLDNPAIKVKFSKGVDGYHFSIYELGKPTYYLDSFTKDNKKVIAYPRSELTTEAQNFVCEVAGIQENTIDYSARNADDGSLRAYRIAIVATGEYSQFHLTRLGVSASATDAVKKEAVLSAMVTTMNRVNGVFERDLSVRFNIVDNSSLIYLDPATDDLSNSSAGSLIEETQTRLDAVLGASNYDIGHAFSTGAGGLAGLGVVCVTGQKGSGVTGTNSPFGDLYDIDYVAHEIGHQFGANHTFNGTSDSCGGGNRNSATAVEPGSGSTIMAYAGICSPHNVQNFSNDYFHSVSIAEMWNIITTTGNCATKTSTGNTAPTANAGLDYSIPRSTPFVLKGTATDADVSNTLTYNWEQIDAEVDLTLPPAATNTGGAMFRSLPSITSPNRYLPNLATVVAGNTATWEVLPAVERAMNFSFTVRDNHLGGGSSARDDVRIFVINALPFNISSQNTSTTWDVGTAQTITWNVGATDSAPINCKKVNIKLSTDGGVSFPITLASEINNSGSHTFIVPNNATSSARIMVEAADNVFYDVNDVNFTIISTAPTFIVANLSGNGEACNTNGDSFTYQLGVDFVNGFSEQVSFTAAGEPSGSSVVFTPSTINANGTIAMQVSNLEGAAAQNYTIEVTGTSTTLTQKINVDFTVLGNDFEAPTLASPVNNATDVLLTPTLNWSAVANATAYDIQIATDANFANVVHTGTSTTTDYTTSVTLSDTSMYYWRVKPKNKCGEGAYTSPFSFTTKVCAICSSVANTDYGTSTTLVQFNTIDNASGKPSGYSDYKSISTNVVKGSSYDLTVHANTDGAFTTRTLVWIDWNQNCSFEEEGEVYDLGTAEDTVNGATSSSPLSIAIPSTATLGNTVMRVTTKYFDDGLPTACENGADAEVEDYTLTVEGNSAATEDLSFARFNLFPNPSKGDFNLQFELKDAGKVAVQLFDIQGRLIGEKYFYENSAIFSETISFNAVAKGIYLLKVTNGNTQTTRKVVIE